MLRERSFLDFTNEIELNFHHQSLTKFFDNITLIARRSTYSPREKFWDSMNLFHTALYFN